MDSGNFPRDGSISKTASGKRGTPNKRWRPEYDNFLIPVLVDQARRGLKCDKSFKRAAFNHAATAVNGRFGTDFSSDNVENHYRTLKARYAEIKKARDLSGAGWDDELKMITLDPIVAVTYIEAHPGAKAFINKPIENYDGLRVICGDDNATGSYAASVYSDFGENPGCEDNDNDNVESVPIHQVTDDENDDIPIPNPPAANSPATSSSIRSNRSNKGLKGTSSMSDLITVVGQMASAIKDPTHWTDTLYKRVMEVDGYDKRVLVEVLDYLQCREGEARGFMVRDIDLRKDWINKFLSRMD